MNQYLGKNVSHIFGSEGYNYSKVVFNNGRPPLDAELNLLQELQENLARRSTMEMPSGWISFRDFATGRSSSLSDAFLTQSPAGAIPEIALVNGWPLIVTNTGSEEPFVNKIDLSGAPLTKGSRVDGVFLEAWRAVVSDEFKDITQPASAITNSSIYGVWALNDTTGWAVGANGCILKTDNSGVTWKSQVSPTSYDLNDIAFLSNSIGFAVGNNGTLVKTDNGGATWYRVPLTTTDDLLSICVAGSSFVAISGRNGTIFTSKDGATFIKPVSSKSSLDLKSIFFYDDTMGWVVGATGTLMRTQDGGATWNKLNVSIPDANGVEQSITSDLNGVKFVNLNDGWAVGNGGLILKTNDGGLRWSDTSSNVYDQSTGSYHSINNDFNSLTIKKSLPLRITLALYDSGYFKSASYLISPTTVSLFYVRRSDSAEFRVDMQLASYATNADLVTAINNIRTSDNRRVYTATLGYTDSAYESHTNQATWYDSGTTDMRFSLGDKAWITGSSGILLSTANSGAQWVPEDLGIAFDMYDVSFSSFSLGWAVGANAAVVRFDSSDPDKWVVQTTDLHTTPQQKVFFEGNHDAAISKNLNFDSISPEVKVTTADRVQIQYRIRVVEGVDIGQYQEAGLGSPYVYSQGPNTNVVGAGSFYFTNMGTENGDFGLWRARCKNTVDGYAYAIPMFLVSKRNSAPYDPDSNINGSTNAALYVVRPDDIQPNEITSEDVVDIRKTVSSVELTALMQGTLDLLMENNLRTKMNRDPELGTQVGSTIVRKDSFSLQEDINSLLAGTYSAAAIGGVTGFAGPQDGSGIVALADGSLPTQDQLTFPTYLNSIWHPQPEKFTAIYAGTGITGVDGQAIPGGFTGFGSPTVQFVLGATGILNGADTTNLKYLITGSRIDYTRHGLVSSPDVPMSVRNADSQSTTKTAYYRSVQTGGLRQDLLEAPSAAVGYTDYAEAVPQDNGVGVKTSSMVKVHRFLQPMEATNIIRVPKDFQGYTCYTLEYLKAVDGAHYRVKEVRDREIPAGQTTASSANLIIYLDEAYRVAAGTVVEVVLGVNEVPVSGSVVTPSMLGINGSDRGETTDSFRNPYISILDKKVKSVQGFYRSVLLDSSTSIGSAQVTVTTNDGSLIMGLPSMPMTSDFQAQYVWYTTASLDAFNDANADVWWNTVPVDTSVPITGFGTDTITIALKTGVGGANISTSASLMVPALVQDTTFVNSTTTSYAEVLYRTVVPQATDNLPNYLSFEVLSMGNSMHVSNLGFGGGLTGMPYANPLMQIAIPDDTVGTESFYHNLFGMNTKDISEDGGYLTLPMYQCRSVGSTLTLSAPKSDMFGRYFYTQADSQLVFKAAGMNMPQPRKMFVPMLARIVSSVTSPVLRGEVVLLVVSQSKNTDTTNTMMVGPNGGGAAIAMYRVPGMPLTRG